MLSVLRPSYRVYWFTSLDGGASDKATYYAPMRSPGLMVWKHVPPLSKPGERLGVWIDNGAANTSSVLR